MADTLVADTDYIPDEALFESIDDYLIAIADGLRLAQQRLNSLQVSGLPGQPATMYHLPKLDFELKMAFKLSQARTTSQAEGIEVLGNKKLTIRPLMPGAGSAEFVAEGASLIRGTFVAIPAHGGRPAPELRVGLSRPGGVRAGSVVPHVEIRVLITNVAGELLGGVEVSFNIDRDQLESLNSVTPGIPVLSDKTYLENAIVLTSSSGIAACRLCIADTENVGTSIPIVIDALGKTEMVIYQVELGGNK